MKISYDPAKRVATLEARGLDMARVSEVFDGPHIIFDDLRFEYGKNRHLTFGYLNGRMVVFAWTARDGTCRVISLRKANGRERKRYESRLGRSG